MTGLFVDTSGWFEASDVAAPLHEPVSLVLVTAGRRLFTTTYVLAELATLMLSRLGHAQAARVGTVLRASSDVVLVHPTDADEAEAWRLFVDRSDKRYSMTDCLSFVVMRRLKLTTAVALDRHFTQEGFEVVP